MSGQARNWCFTLNNPTITPEAVWDRFEPWLRYGVLQLEKGDSGTPHYQGYVELKKQYRLGAMKRSLPSAHFEVRRGTREEARDYCMKDDSRLDGPYEFGQFKSKQGSRSDLKGLVDMAKRGASRREIAEEMPGTFIRYNRGIQSLLSLYSHKRKFPPLVTLLYGPTGCGKTRLVYDHKPLDSLWVNGLGKGGWFDGYDGQPCVLLDDFAGALSHTGLCDLLRLLDRYPVRVQFKGGHVDWAPLQVVVTTNIHPRLWYDWTKRQSQYPALARRFAEVRAWSANGDRCHTLWRPDLDVSTKPLWDKFWAYAPFEAESDSGALVSPTLFRATWRRMDPFEFLFGE